MKFSKYTNIKIIIIIEKKKKKMLKLHKISCTETVEETLEIWTNFRVCVGFFFPVGQGERTTPSIENNQQARLKY